MASGSSSGNRMESGSRPFDFASDDVLCSYDDLVGLNASNGKRPDSAGAGGKDFREGRIGRPLQNVHCPQEGFNRPEVIFVVEKCMKRHVDNLLGVLEGLNGRLKHLELYCYNMEKSMEDLRSDLAHDEKERVLKLRSLEKHLQEVHRSVQILRDRQELAETQKELAKLQVAQKESSVISADEQKDDSDATNKQLVLALPQKPMAPSPTIAARAPEPHILPSQPVLPSSSVPVQQPSYVSQDGGFYSHQPTQVLNQPPQLQSVPQPQQPQLAPQPQQPQLAPQSQQPQLAPQPQQPQLAPQPQQPQLAPQPQQPQLAPQPQPIAQPVARYAPSIPRSQDLPVQTPSQQTHAVSQSQSHYPGYAEQWPQQAPQQFQQPASQPQQQAPTPVQYPQGATTYPPYQSPQPVKAPGESFQGPTPVSYSRLPTPGSNPHEISTYGYGGPGGSMPQPPPQRPPTRPSPSQSPPVTQLSKGGYTSPAPYSPYPPAQGYSSYDADGGGSRPAHSQPMYGGSYPPSSMSGPQNQPPPPPSAALGHPFRELVDRAVSMGYPRDLVAGAVYRMEESGQPANFNILLDMLNGRASSPAQRGWSG